jgi:phosphatidylserine decarboxylase
MKIHKEGYLTIFISVVLLFGILYILSFYLKVNSLAFNIIYFILVIFYFFIVRFFRVPIFSIEKNANNILSPANGKIVVIEQIEEKEFLNTLCTQISIFMSPNDVHLNRYPISGVIKYFKYHKGKYYVAWHPKSSTLNERTTVVIENENNVQIMVRQIAGFVARRIKCYAEVNKKVEQGDELGFIKFGSRVDIFIPLNCKINVKLNQKVIGGKTIIATFE